MTYDELGRILDTNENARKFLNYLSIMEGTSTFSNPYLAQGGTNGKLLTTGYDDHPAAYGQGKWRYKKLSGGTGPSTANGKYAFIHGTWQGLKRQLGSQLKFDPRGQDIAALSLIAQRGQLQNVMNGNIPQAIQALGSTWASLTSADQSKTNQHKRGAQFSANALKTVGFDPSKWGMTANGVVQGANLGSNYPISGGTPQSLGGMSAMSGANGYAGSYRAPSGGIFDNSTGQQRKPQQDPLQAPTEVAKMAQFGSADGLSSQYKEAMRNMDKMAGQSPMNNWYAYWRKR